MSKGHLQPLVWLRVLVLRFLTVLWMKGQVLRSPLHTTPQQSTAIHSFHHGDGERQQDRLSWQVSLTRIKRPPCKLRLQEANINCKVLSVWSSPPGGALPIMDYTGRLRPKGVPFSGWRNIKRQGFHELRYRKGRGKLTFLILRHGRMLPGTAFARHGLLGLLGDQGNLRRPRLDYRRMRPARRGTERHFVELGRRRFTRSLWSPLVPCLANAVPGSMRTRPRIELGGLGA